MTSLESVLKFGLTIHCDDIKARGSGFILRADGLIGTNHHVVHKSRTGVESKSIRIVFPDGTESPATIIRQDREKDFAILKTNRKFTYIPSLQEYSGISPYQKVIFVGRGLDVPGLSLHRGWISAKAVQNGINLFQVDGPINQGNSGGPLFDEAGHLIGIVTKTEAKFSEDLIDILEYLQGMDSPGSIKGQVRIMGIDVLGAFREIITWLNRNRHVGIGYAYSTDYIVSALREIPEN